MEKETEDAGVLGDKRKMTLASERLVFDETALTERARRHLTVSCMGGLAGNRPDALEVFRREAEQVRRTYCSGVQLQTVLSSFGAESVEPGGLRLGDVFFSCAVLERLDREVIRGGIVYLMGVSGIAEANPGVPLLDLFYIDAWGTAYVDTGRELLREFLMRRERGASVSDSFGPGYYGMDESQLGSFFQVLDAAVAGVELAEGGGLRPLKSCAGFYLIMDPGAEMLPPSCAGCRGTAQGCQYCQSSFDF